MSSDIILAPVCRPAVRRMIFLENCMHPPQKICRNGKVKCTQRQKFGGIPAYDEKQQNSIWTSGGYDPAGKYIKGNDANMGRRKNMDDPDHIRELLGDRKLIRARKARLRFKLLNSVFLAYTKLLLKTCRFRIENRELFHTGIMFGFWHEDCYSMELLLSELSKEHRNICAIVTVNTRGDYIEDTLSHNGGEALRIPDGMEMKAAFRKMLETARRPDLIMAAALDGPAGPYREPKKLLFMLAREREKHVVYAHFTYKHIIRLKKRWDKYVIPLPFSRVTARFESLGVIDKQRLANFDEWSGEIRC